MPKQQFATEWTDALGQTYKPGDLVAIATVNNKSPQIVIAEVVSINLTDPKGNRYFTWGKSPAFAEGKYRIDGATPTVTVTAIPVHSGRGFGRYGQPDAKVTYRVVENILALPGKTRADIAA